MKETEGGLRRLLELSPDAVFLHGLDGRFLYVNDAACAIVGHTREELLLLHPWDFVVTDRREYILALWEKLTPGVPVMVDGVMRRKDGTTFPTEVWLIRFEDGGQDRIAAFCRDLSSRRRAEAALLSQERNRLARDIHDALAHGLTTIAVQLEAARQVIGTVPDEAAVHLGHALRLARECLRDSRRSVQALRPEILEVGDLTEALRQLVSSRSVGRREEFHLRLHDRPRPLPGETEAHLLRVAQEALANVLKHAHAANVLVELGYTNCEVRLHIEDDGRGFDPERQADRGEAVGLASMEERAELIGARLILRSSPGGGTAVTVTVPVPPVPEEHSDAR